MNHILVNVTLLLISSLATTASAASDSPATQSADKQTIANLQSAYSGETNAHATYLAYAKKADDEGYKQAASMFRAAARSEEIHAANHARVLKSLGATPEAKLKTPEVEDTAENLKEAIEDESHERDTMYPEFTKLARQANLNDAVQTFTYARMAEAEHAKLFKETLDNLEQTKSQPQQILVCSVCGYTARKVEGFCPICMAPREKFETIK